jgi:hypothetical protein
MIFLKIFFGVWLIRKNHQRRKTESGDVWPPSSDFGRNRQIPASLAGILSAGIWLYWLDSSHTSQISASLAGIWFAGIMQNRRISADISRFWLT